LARVLPPFLAKFAKKPNWLVGIILSWDSANLETLPRWSDIIAYSPSLGGRNRHCRLRWTSTCGRPSTTNLQRRYALPSQSSLLGGS
jgi:hypothetical protein